MMKVDVSNILAEQISSVELLNEADKVTLIKTLFQQLCEVKGELSSLKKMIFGSKTEKFVSPLSSTSQLSLAIEAESIASCNIGSAKKIEYVKANRNVELSGHPGRMKLPEGLYRKDVVIQPESDVTGLNKIGEDITEVLEYEPGNLYVKRFIRPKYAKPGNTGVIMAPLPPRALNKHMFGEGLLAQIVIDKYVDHLPLHRQIERYKRSGVTLSSSTMSDAVKSLTTFIESLGQAHLKEVLATHYLSVDETPIKVQDKDKKGATHRGFYWVYYNVLQRLVLFDYREGRGREGPLEMLKTFTGYIQCDGFTVYDVIEKQLDVTLLGCLAHARRMLFEALDNNADIANYVLDHIQQLYAIEAEIKSLRPDEKKRIRQEKSVPILTHLDQWMEDAYIKLSAKSSMTGKALAYSLERWDRLSRYTENGDLEIDNNLVENSIRPVAIGKKNYLFCGSHDAARRAAILYSLFGTCKLHGLDPHRWLTEVLAILPTHPINRIRELLPQNYKSFIGKP